MYNKLFIAALVTAFSINNFAAETPDYSQFPAAQAEYCQFSQSNSCKRMATIFGFVVSVNNKVDAEGNPVPPTEEEQNQLNLLKDEVETLGRIIDEETAAFNTAKALKSILDAAEQKSEENSEKIADELNIKAEPQE